MDQNVEERQEAKQSSKQPDDGQTTGGSTGKQVSREHRLAAWLPPAISWHKSWQTQAGGNHKRIGGQGKLKNTEYKAVSSYE